MSTEHLTAEQSLKIYKIRASAMGDSVSADEADGFIAGYRAALNEVEQQTKQLKELNETLVSANTEANMKIDHLKEERDRAIGLIMRCNNVYLPEVLQDEIQDFLNQLNQNNEK